VARSYHTLDSEASASEEKLTSFLRKNGQQLLPMVDLITQSRVAINELIECVGRAMLETLLEVSAEQVAGARQPGKVRAGAVRWYGRQPGRVYLGDRKLAVERPRLRRRGRGRHKEVAVPAYAALQNRKSMQKRMLDIVMNGVSTRHYRHVVPEMAESVGISKSSVSRETIEASEAAFKELLERRLDDQDFIVIYLDGLHCGEHCVIGAVGVDAEGRKRVLGIQEGATENSAACRDLLQNLVERGLNPERERLFVMDGSKALRSAIQAVFGAKAPVQRCRQHKLRNVVERLPREQQAQTRSLIRAAWKLEAKEGMARLRKLAEWLRQDYPDAAGSLLEGMEECFTINRLNIPFSLHRCLATTNLIESSQSGVRMRTRRVCRWRATMPARWVAAAFLATENNFRRIMGYRDLWALKAILRGEKEVKAKEAVA
jgi:putative transposase